MNRYLILVTLAALFVIGCSSVPSSGGPADAASPASGQHPQRAECLVCKKNADLACVDVAVDKSTAVHEYNGRTYYFCIEECRDKFAEYPVKYLSK
jgi:YHS domain-containing protein